MIVEYGAILKVDFRRFGLPQRKSEFFNRILRIAAVHPVPPKNWVE
jgi:hypothetical protein